MASGGYFHAKGWLSQALLETAWDQRLDGLSLKHAKPWPWADMAPLVRIVVPRLGVSRIVLSNSSGRTLAFGPAHLPGTGLPGDVGHSVVTGHRDTHFRFLKDMDVDDVIRVQKADGTYVTFVVIGTNVFDAKSAHLTEVEGQKILTLVTCYPFDALQNGSPLRYAVFAEAKTQHKPRPRQPPRDHGSMTRR